MSEENKNVVEEQVVETATKETNVPEGTNNEVGGLIAESKKYRTRAQSAEQSPVVAQNEAPKQRAEQDAS